MKLMLAAVSALPVLFAGSAPVTPISGLSVPRAAHTATLLASGKVLIAGGCTVGTCELDSQGATTEIFDAARSRFDPGPRMSRPRVGHTATRLPNGDVLIAGGWDGPKPTASAEIYVAATGRFVQVGSMREARGGAVAARLDRGRVVIIGGSGRRAALRSAEIYDTRRRSFKPGGAMAAPRSGHSATRLASGKVLITGGSGAGRVFRSAELYDPTNGRFTQVGRLKVARHKHASVALAGGRALILGGSSAADFQGRYASAEIFEPRTGAFRLVGRMANARFKIEGSAVALRRGSVLVAGGGAAVEVYNVGRQRFGRIGVTGARLAFATATLLPDGRVLFAGGYDDELMVSRRAWLIRA